MTKNAGEHIIIFTDGSSRGNPGPGGWGSVIVFPGKSKQERRVVELGGREDDTTNNRMEMKAVIEALRYVIERYMNEKSRPLLTVYTDSEYLVKGVTEWIGLWEKRGWRKRDGDPVKNEDLWKELKALMGNMSISWKHVSGHTGVVGNERADEIACAFADGKDPGLKDVSFEEYGKNIFSLEQTLTKKEIKAGSRSSAKAYSYVSSVEGEVRSHKSWDDCKKRVEGISGARFKKVYSPDEERELIRDWSA